jgi:hypothetical protein
MRTSSSHDLMRLDSGFFLDAYYISKLYHKTGYEKNSSNTNYATLDMNKDVMAHE